MVKILEKEGWQLNPNERIRNAILKRVESNNGLCPCANDSVDKHCPCSNYRELDKCCCTLYVKSREMKKLLLLLTSYLLFMKVCKNCNNLFADDANFCPDYWSQLESVHDYNQAKPKPKLVQRIKSEMNCTPKVFCLTFGVQFKKMQP